jgi:LysE type translocator
MVAGPRRARAASVLANSRNDNPAVCSMNHFALFVSVATLWALAAMSPGPNFLVTARISITRSRGEGLLAVAGIGVGTAVWGTAGCFGVQALFIAAPWLYLTIKLIGAIYMVWFGARLLWSSYRANEADRGRVAPMGLRHSAFSPPPCRSTRRLCWPSSSSRQWSQCRFAGTRLRRACLLCRGCRQPISAAAAGSIA